MTRTEEHWLGGIRQRRFIRWSMTQWCNYHCSYCQQDHRRDQVYKGSPGHAFDVASPIAWLEAFERRFSEFDCTFHITGGEPLLDRRNFAPFLNTLLSYSWVKYAEIDTNGTSQWAPLDLSKVGLHLSYHPEHTTLEQFLATLRRLRVGGWNVLVVTLVLPPDSPQWTELDELQAATRAAGVPLAVNPVHGVGVARDYTDKQLAAFRRLIPDSDLYHVYQSPRGDPCLYPSIAYEVDPDGSLIVACHRNEPSMHGNLFRSELPALMPAYSPCPKKECSCEERYSFLERMTDVGDSPKVAHSDRLRAHQGLKLIGG